MKIEDLYPEYDKLQLEFGDPSLHSIYNGGCDDHPDICFVFMNPTGRNIASYENWKGPRSPWIGTKNIWDLFIQVNLIDENIYKEIKSIKGSEWTEEFAEKVYQNIKDHRIFITNLGKCNQIDARPLPDSVYLNYLELLKKEFKIIKPKVIVLFGNQVSSIVLGEKISVSSSRKCEYSRIFDGDEYKFYSVYYPIGNGRFNIDKSIEDIKWIQERIKDGTYESINN